MTGVPADATAERRQRWRERIEESILPPLVALAIAAVVGDLLILTFGQAPGEVYRQLIEGTWGNAYGFGQVIYKATTLTFTGLAVALGIRAGLFNIGAESQLAAGGFAAALAGLAIPAATPVVRFRGTGRLVVEAVAIPMPERALKLPPAWPPSRPKLLLPAVTSKDPPVMP